MRRILGQRWVWITALFAAINVAGLLKIISLLERERRALAVESFDPQGEVPTACSFTVRFNRAVVGPGEVGDCLDPSLIQFTPGLAGRWVWEDPRTAAFRPEEPLRLATAYTVAVSRRLTSAAGHSLPRDAVFCFQTPPLKLEGIRQTNLSPAGRAALDPRFGDMPMGRVTLALDFSDKVLPEEAARHLTLRAEAAGRNLGIVDYALASRVPSRTVIVTTNPVGGKALVARIEKGLSGLSGPLGLPEDITRTLLLDSSLSIGHVTAQAAFFASPAIQVRCTQSLDVATARQFIEVEPKVDFAVRTDWAGFELSGPFEPAKRYRLTFRAGLKAQNGTTLGKDVVRSVRTPELAPALRFKSPGIYLSAEGSLRLPLEAVNVKESEVTVDRIYENNIVYFLREIDSYRAPADLGRRVGKEVFKFSSPPNKPQVVEPDLKGLLADERHGVFLVCARDTRGDSWLRAQKLVLITDLGISVKRSENDLLVWVNALSTAAPVAGAAVSVFTRSNQKVFEGVTDASGLVHAKGIGGTGEAAPFAVAAHKDGDLAFVELAKAELDRSPFDIGGRPYLRRGYEAFVYSDRGIYRPGGKAILHAIVRGMGPETPRDFPVQFHITRPDGRPFKAFPARLTEWGSAEVEVEIPPYAPTGPYKVGLRLPQGKSDLGEVSFLVEEFLPDRMKVELSAEPRRFRADEAIQLKVKATHLFGAPAAGREVEARCELVASEFSPDAWKGYRFADSSRKYSPIRLGLGQMALDEKGETVFRVNVPAGLTPPSALAAVITATVKEVGGRGVTATLSREVDVYRHYVGLSRDRRDGYAEAKKEERLSCVVVRPDGSAVERAELTGGLYAIHWNSVLKVDDEGRYRYASEREEARVAELSCSVLNGRGEVVFTPPDVGEYEVRMQDQASGASAGLAFYCAGEGFVPWAMEKPDRLELVADKPSYAPGEAARILIKAPFAGQALITIESDRIHFAQALMMETNTKEVTLPIEASFGPNVYCSATVIRKITPQVKWAPHRAYGIIPLVLDSRPRQLQVRLDAPQEMRPGGPLRVNLHVTDAKGTGARAEVTLAAVDEGICQLTRFATPDPWAFFYARRGLAVTTHDVYSLLMPELDKKRVGADSAPGGDSSSADYDPRLLSPVSVARVRPVALWKSGIVTGEDGRATVTLDVPDFTGQLRLMAVAASAQDYGSAARPALVKQPLMLQASFPRFLSPGDEFTVPVTVFNHTGRGGSVELKGETAGGIELLSGAPASLDLDAGREGTVRFHARAPAVPGPASMAIAARLGDERTTATVEIPVRPPVTLRELSGSGTVEAGKSVRFTLPGGWVPKTDKFALSFSSQPTLQLGNSLSYLLHYPYACIEQTTSSGFPLLYLADVAEATDPDAFRKEDTEAYVQATIDRLMAMQGHGGGFACWPGYPEIYPWGSAYATHFLIEAKKAGYAVPKDNLDAALGYLDHLLAATRADDGGLESKAYACYVLAHAGKPNASWTHRLLEEREKLPPYSRFHVIAALAAMKDHKLAASLLQSEPLPPVSKARDTGGVLYSGVREAAILLSAYLDIEPRHPNVPVLVKRLEGAMKEGRWATTQENSFSLLALGKYARQAKTQPPDYQAEVLAGGQRLASFTHRDKPFLKPAGLGGSEVEIRVAGSGSLYYYWRASGIPLSDEVPEADSGLKVRRRFLSRDGVVLDLARIPHGELIIVELSIKNDTPVDNVVINDLLPAGFEIENPRLATNDGQLDEAQDESQDSSTADDPPLARPARRVRRASPGFEPDRVEMRDDRLILFAHLRFPATHTYRYVVRAVTRGRFRLPALTAFCMYDPTIASTHGAGRIEVVGEK